MHHKTEPRFLRVPLDQIGTELGGQHVEDVFHPRLTGRTAARAAAIQALYESDITNRKTEHCIDWIAQELKLSPNGKKFAHQLATEAEANRSKIDTVLNSYSPVWKMDTASIIVRNVLRVATAESRLFPETNEAVIISEAVKLTKIFDTDAASRFVNGILGAIAKDEEATHNP